MRSRLNRYYVLIAIIVVCALLFTFYPDSLKYPFTSQRASYPNTPCFQALNALPHTPQNWLGKYVDIYLIDLEAIAKIKKSCSADLDLPISVMIPEGDMDAAIDNTIYNVTTFVDMGDYIMLRSYPPRVLLKLDYHRIGPLLVPVDLNKFTNFYERSRFIPCLDMDMNPTASVNRSALPEKFEVKLAQLRDQLIDMDTMPFITDGTLLGWYRECSIIPHTTDGDIAVLKREYRPRMIEQLKLLTGLKFNARLGREYDSIAFKIKSHEDGSIDLYIAYDEDDDRIYTSGIDYSSGRRFKWIKPRPKGFCSGILRGKLFFVPCNVEETIEADYGKNWARDHPSSQFNRIKSSADVFEIDKFSPEEMRKYYIFY